jgi:hypothetical protein
MYNRSTIPWWQLKIDIIKPTSRIHFNQEKLDFDKFLLDKKLTTNNKSLTFIKYLEHTLDASPTS